MFNLLERGYQDYSWFRPEIGGLLLFNSASTAENMLQRINRHQSLLGIQVDDLYIIEFDYLDGIISVKRLWKLLWNKCLQQFEIGAEYAPITFEQLPE